MSRAHVSTKRYNPLEVRQRILAQALDLFAGAGFAATGVEHIASAAGVTKGALYHHFASKDEILRVLYEDYLAQRTQRCKEIIAETTDPYEQMGMLIGEVFENAVSAKGLLGLFLRERELLGREAFTDARRAQREFYDLFESVIRRGQDSGVFRSDINARHAAYSVLGTLVWAEFWYDASRTEAGRFVDDTKRLLLHGLAAPAPSPRRQRKPTQGKQ